MLYINIIHTFNLGLNLYLRISLSFPNENSNYFTYTKYVCNLWVGLLLEPSL